MKTMFTRHGFGSALAGLALLAFALPAMAADDYGPLLKALPSAKHNLVEVIKEVTKGGEVPIQAKYEMDKNDLKVGAYTAAKGLAVEPEKNVFKEYNGVATGAAWKPETEVFKDAEHLTRSASYVTLMSMTKLTLLDIVNKAVAARPGIPFEIKAYVENGSPIFAVLVAHDGTMSRLTFDLVTGSRKT